MLTGNLRTAQDAFTEYCSIAKNFNYLSQNASNSHDRFTMSVLLGEAKTRAEVEGDHIIMEQVATIYERSRQAAAWSRTQARIENTAAQYGILTLKTVVYDNTVKFILSTAQWLRLIDAVIAVLNGEFKIETATDPTQFGSIVVTVSYK
jgi:transposase